MGVREIAAKILKRFSETRPGTVVQACPRTVVTTGLGSKIDALAGESPTLQKNLSSLLKARWTIMYGEAGKGSFCNKHEKIIVIDPSTKGHPKAVVRTLAHETGHALYTADPYVSPLGKTRQQYVDANIARALKDEGEATLMNCQVRREIIANGGADIGIAGAKAEQYEKIFLKHQDQGNRDVARIEIGKIFADGEHPSTDAKKTYREYYSKPFADFYDARGNGK